ncbi:MAG: hypothetical protein ABR568_21670, partial [Pyrinomonadaceae bacterium]
MDPSTQLAGSDIQIHWLAANGSVLSGDAWAECWDPLATRKMVLCDESLLLAESPGSEWTRSCGVFGSIHS